MVKLINKGACEFKVKLVNAMFYCIMRIILKTRNWEYQIDPLCILARVMQLTPFVLHPITIC